VVIDNADLNAARGMMMAPSASNPVVLSIP
jgi:hypothetical protein